jgi:hypothetical protein
MALHLSRVLALPSELNVVFSNPERVCTRSEFSLWGLLVYLVLAILGASLNTGRGISGATNRPLGERLFTVSVMFPQWNAEAMASIA